MWFFFFQAEDGIRDKLVTGVQTCALPISTFQIMRRTHASLSRQAGIDPKLVADQLGHGLGVNLDVYTVAALDKRQERGGGAGVRTGPSRFGLKVRKGGLHYCHLPKLAVIDLVRVFRFET